MVELVFAGSVFSSLGNFVEHYADKVSAIDDLVKPESKIAGGGAPEVVGSSNDR